MPRWIDTDALPVRNLWSHYDKYTGHPVQAVLLEDINAAETALPAGWIRVTPETMPREGDLVSVICSGGYNNLVFEDAVEQAEWYCGEGWIIVNHPELRATVSYWAPIPELPVTEER